MGCSESKPSSVHPQGDGKGSRSGVVAQRESFRGEYFGSSDGEIDALEEAVRHKTYAELYQVSCNASGFEKRLRFRISLLSDLTLRTCVEAT